MIILYIVFCKKLVFFQIIISFESSKNYNDIA